MRVVLIPGMDGTGKMFQPLLKSCNAKVETVVVDWNSYGDVP